MEDIHKALLEVTKIAVDTDADSSKFPKNWLMIHRWGKGKKSNDNKLPSGEQIEYLTVGGRTSAYVRNLQRKVGPVSVGGNTKSSGKRKKATKKEDKTEDEDELSSDSEAPKKKAVLQPRKICKSGLADSGDG